MASTTAWYPFPRSERHQRSWLLDDGTILREPALETTPSQRRVRVAEAPDVADFMKNVDNFVGPAARVCAARQGRHLWMALGKLNTNPLDLAGDTGLTFEDLNPATLKPHFLEASRYHTETRVGWRYGHTTLPVQAQIECAVYRRGYNGRWIVETKLVFPNTSPLNADTPHFLTLERGKNWPSLVEGEFGPFLKRLDDWRDKNPVEWCDGFEFGSVQFEHERQAIHFFAKIIREVAGLDEIEIPNLLNVKVDNEDIDGTMQMLSLRLVRTNVSQDLMEMLSDYLSGEQVVEQIKMKWLELTGLFRRLGMVVENPSDTTWWNFLVKGADQAPVEIQLHTTDEIGTGPQSRHAVMVDLATGTITVACSQTAKKDDAAIQWETSLIKAEMTGQKDRFLAYVDHVLDERQAMKAQELMAAELKKTKPAKGEKQ